MCYVKETLYIDRGHSLTNQPFKLLAVLFLLLTLGGPRSTLHAQLPLSYAGIYLGMEEPLVYTMLEKNGWPFAMERSQTLRISLNTDFVESFTISFIGRKVRLIKIKYKSGIENFGHIRFAEMEGLLVEKYGNYKDRERWSSLNDRGESISHVRWIWESSNSRLVFRGRMSDSMDRPGTATTDSHAYQCDILLKDVEIFLERSRKEITNLEKLP